MSILFSSVLGGFASRYISYHCITVFGVEGASMGFGQDLASILSAM